MIRTLFVVVMTITTIPLAAQTRTVGTLLHDSTRTFKGYTLFAPITSTTTYLIDHDGQVMHTWPSAYRPGQAVMLLDDGSLLRTATPAMNAPLNGGGSGGIVERISWDGTVQWRYQHYGPNYRAHHDVEIMPNGNILLIVWYPIPRDTALALGRRANKLVDQTMWLERIIEVKPVGTDSGEIVWTWDTRDHLIQADDPAKPGYGVIPDHPERIDINAGGNRTDWLHLNSVRYNAARDEVMVSVHNLHELWIIQRSSGRLVYRWGNPQIHGRGTPQDQQLFAQHDARWIDDGLPGAGNITIFNNQAGRQGNNYSTLDEITPPLDENGTYIIDQGAAFGPTTTTWRYVPPTGTSFYGANVSGWTRLPNGNAMACIGPSGNLVELTNDGTIVWRYVSPVGMNGIARQGQTPQNNMLFKVYRYGIDHPAFAGKTLRPRGRLEDGPLQVGITQPGSHVSIVYAPGSPTARITSSDAAFARIDAFDLLGRWLGTVTDGMLDAGVHEVDVPRGTCLLMRTR